jgi:hypothetical protein
VRSDLVPSILPFAVPGGLGRKVTEKSGLKLAEDISIELMISVPWSAGHIHHSAIGAAMPFKIGFNPVNRDKLVGPES